MLNGSSQDTPPQQSVGSGSSFGFGTSAPQIAGIPAKKKPYTSFQLFCAIRRLELMKQRDNGQDIPKEASEFAALGNEWKALD